MALNMSLSDKIILSGGMGIKKCSNVYLLAKLNKAIEEMYTAVFGGWQPTAALKVPFLKKPQNIFQVS